MRLLLFALAAVASAQLEHSVGEALSWKSLRRAALGDKGAEQLEETLEIGGRVLEEGEGDPGAGSLSRRSRRRRRSGTGERRGRVEIQATRTGARAPEPLKRHPQTGERRAPAGLKIAAQTGRRKVNSQLTVLYHRSPTHTMCSA